jgi:transcriptional regulator with XRE-family HTH domain
VQDPEQLAADLGRNVRRLRLRRNMTLEALAERAAVAKGTVIAVEQARANPNIATLCRLADALGVGVDSLIEAAGGPRVRVKRADATPALWSSDEGGRGLFLMGTDPPDVVELWDWSLSAGESFDGAPHPVGSFEMLSVLEGKLVVTAGDEEHALGEGDTIHFESDVAHRYANPGKKANRFVMAVYEPLPERPAPPEPVDPADQVPPSHAL